MGIKTLPDGTQYWPNEPARQANHGGAAFPTVYPESEFSEKGMSLRDYFAAKAMAMFGAGGGMWPSDADVPMVVRRAYLFADAMLAERDK